LGDEAARDPPTSTVSLLSAVLARIVPLG